MSVSAAGYLRISSADVGAWMDFGTSVLGLMDAAREDADGARFLRMDDHPFRFMIERETRTNCWLQGSNAQIVMPGRTRSIDWKTQATRSQPDRLTKQNAAVSPNCLTSRPCGQYTELYWGRELDYTPLVSLPGSHFLSPVTNKPATWASGIWYCRPRISRRLLRFIRSCSALALLTYFIHRAWVA